MVTIITQRLIQRCKESQPSESAGLVGISDFACDGRAAMRLSQSTGGRAGSGRSNRLPKRGPLAMVHIGIPGIGFMGMIPYLAAQKVKGARVTAIASRNPKKLARHWRGIRGDFG